MLLVLLSLGHVVGQQAHGVHQSFLVSEVFGWGLHVIDQKTEVVGQVGGDLILSGLSNGADALDQVLVGSLHIPKITLVNLKPNVLDRVFVPHLELMLSDQEKRQSKIKQDSLDVLLAPHAKCLHLETTGNEPQG